MLTINRQLIISIYLSKLDYGLKKKKSKCKTID